MHSSAGQHVPAALPDAEQHSTKISIGGRFQWIRPSIFLYPSLTLLLPAAATNQHAFVLDQPDIRTTSYDR